MDWFNYVFDLHKFQAVVSVGYGISKCGMIGRVFCFLTMRPSLSSPRVYDEAQVTKRDGKNEVSRGNVLNTILEAFRVSAHKIPPSTRR